MKRLISAFLTLALVFSLTACGGEDPGKTPEPPRADQSQEMPPTTPEPTPAPEPAPTPDPPTTPEPTPAPEPVPAVVPLRIMKGPGWHGEYETDGYRDLCTASWEYLALMDDAYPALADALWEWNTDQSVGAYSFVQEFLAGAKETMAQSPEYFGGFTYESEYTVQRADSLVLSVREDVSSYTGGVHPNYGTVGLNFDTATGARLELTDVLTKTDGLNKLLAEKLRGKYPSEPFAGLDELLMTYSPESYSWTLSYQGITFYFSPYEIAPYAAGLLTATIWFDEIPELFREEYTVTPKDGYAMALPQWFEVEVDLNRGDDVRDTLSVNNWIGEYGAQYLKLQLNGQEYLEESWCAFSMKSYLICPGDSGFYLCVEASGENDYCTIYTYDLSSETPRIVADYSGAGFRNVWDPDAGIDGVFYTEVFNDPVEFTLGSKCNLLGTKTAFRRYTVETDGTFLPLQDIYDLERNPDPIVSAIPLEVTLLPQNTAETVPAGTEFTFLRTDNESWVDLVMKDGRECRIEIKEIDWTPTINGVPEWECFVNLMYAG